MHKHFLSWLITVAILVGAPLVVHATPPAHSLCSVIPELCERDDSSEQDSDFVLVVNGTTIATSLESPVPDVAIGNDGSARVDAAFLDRSGSLPATTPCVATRSFVPSSASFVLRGESASSPWDQATASWGPTYSGTLAASSFPMGRQLGFVVKLSVRCTPVDGQVLQRTALVTFTRDEVVLPPIDVRVDEVNRTETVAWDSSEREVLVSYSWAIRSEPEACSVVAADADTDLTAVTTSPDWLASATYIGTPDGNGWTRGVIEARYQVPELQGAVSQWKPVLRCTDTARLGLGMYREAGMGTVRISRGVKPGTVAITANPRLLQQSSNPRGASTISWSVASDIDRSTCTITPTIATGAVYLPSAATWQSMLRSGATGVAAEFSYPAPGTRQAWRFTLTCSGADGVPVSSEVQLTSIASGTATGSGKVLNYGIGGTRF